jgi:riboflavin synthase
MRIKVGFERAYAKYVIEKGSIAIDGVSLTINDVYQDAFTVNIIEYTAQSTSLTPKSPGDRVNLEFDVLGKYVESLLNKDTGVSLKNLLTEQGFLKGE